MGSKVDMHTCTDTCTHSTQSVGPEKETPCLCMWGHTGSPMLTCNYAKMMEQMWGSQVAMHTCTDACTHSNQGVHAEKGYLAHGHTYLCRTLQEGEHVFTVR